MEQDENYIPAILELYYSSYIIFAYGCFHLVLDFFPFYLFYCTMLILSELINLPYKWW